VDGEAGQFEPQARASVQRAPASGSAPFNSSNFRSAAEGKNPLCGPAAVAKPLLLPLPWREGGAREATPPGNRQRPGTSAQRAARAAGPPAWHSAVALAARRSPRQ
jgi:hypothetical protein